MRKQRNIARRLLGLTFVLIGLLSLNTRLIHPSGQNARAANRTKSSQQAGPATSFAVANGKIAFAGREGRSPNQNIYTMNPDGSDLQQLTFEPTYKDRPAWSPDGTKIVFSRIRPDNHGEIFVMGADGSNLRQLTHYSSHRNDRFPTWSPDGTKIAFSNHIYPGNTLYVMNADGSELRYVASGENLETDWSPDGTKFAVADWAGMYLINVDGSNRTSVTSTSDVDFDHEPAWSPDGTKIVFTRWTDCDFNDCYRMYVWIVNADGSNLRQLVSEQAGNPSWSPDGTKIIFSRGGGLATVNPDGSDLREIPKPDNLSMQVPSWQAVTLNQPSNPIDDAQSFVSQHYRDFLNREPDTNGLAFWTNAITGCGSDSGCVASKRIDVSAAFFLSIEFQQTGYFVYRSYKASYGNQPGTLAPVRRSEFLPDTQQIGQNLVVGTTGWEQQLENSKQAFAASFVSRSRFTSAFPTSMTPAQFVDTLFLNAGVSPNVNDRNAAINEFSSAANTADSAARARVLRNVVENSALVQQEFNRAFVLMQYFGYLQRNPDDAPDIDFGGYNFWLAKLNEFNGNFIQAEMVKAFLLSTEYRQRFTQ